MYLLKRLTNNLCIGEPGRNLPYLSLTERWSVPFFLKVKKKTNKLYNSLPFKVKHLPYCTVLFQSKRNNYQIVQFFAIQSEIPTNFTNSFPIKKKQLLNYTILSSQSEFFTIPLFPAEGKPLPNITIFPFFPSQTKTYSSENTFTIILTACPWYQFHFICIFVHFVILQ